MSSAFTPAVSDRICAPMNDDHADAVLLYARVYGDLTDAHSARLVAIDPEGMDLVVQRQSAEMVLRIPFERPLKDGEDAHHTLIAMVRQARRGASDA